jgi:hypothetical protein
MNGGDDETRILIRGIIIPVDWDQNGRVRTVGVLTGGEGEYEVAPGGAVDQLIAHLQSEILAEAVLLDHAGPVKKVRVDYFAILDWKESGDWVDARGT